MKLHHVFLMALTGLSLAACADDGRYQDRSTGYQQTSTTAQQRDQNTAYTNQQTDREFRETQVK